MRLGFKVKKSYIVAFELILVTISITLVAWLFNDLTLIDGDVRYKDRWGSIEVEMGWKHTVLCTLAIISLVYNGIILIWQFVSFADGDIRSPYKNLRSWLNEGVEKNTINFIDDEVKTKKINWKKMIKKIIWYGVLVVIVFNLFKIGGTFYRDGKVLYNTSKIYHNTYQQKVEEKQGFYDKMWKTYLQKDKITNVNKETFVLVTKIIMENRADGENVTWKWVRENQHIPYEEFSKFYADLSNFITSQREGYFNIEKQCQLISRQNNTMLDTFPNNMYNKVLNLERIVFEYGFLSDSTRTVFETKTENL